MKMSNFSDLENDIAGDWLDIQKRIQEEDKKEREKNNPKRLNCSYREFYNLICESYFDGFDHDRSQAMHEIMRMVISSNERMPDGFERVWDAFCNSYEHDVSTIECMSCGEHFDITYKRVRPLCAYDIGDHIADTRMMPRQECIYCPKCSRVIGRLDKGTFISLTTSKIHDRKYMEERSNDIR
jgi:hypothetical protein